MGGDISMVEEEKYFMISRREDEVGFRILTREELLKHLQEEVDVEINTNYLLTSAVDMGYFPANSALIIKGKVVKPTAVKVVEKLEIE